MSVAHINFTALSRSSKSGATRSESLSTPRTSWVRSFEPGEAVEDLGELLRQDDVGGDLGHHVDFEPVLTPYQSALAHDLEYP